MAAERKLRAATSLTLALSRALEVVSFARLALTLLPPLCSLLGAAG